MRCVPLVTAVTLVVLAAAPAAAQEFVPPDRRPSGQPAPTQDDYGPNGFYLDIMGFSTRAGAQVTKDEQAVLGSTVDLMQLYWPRLRLRPSFEVGFGRPNTSLGVNAEVIYRFQPDEAPAIPYVGLGAGYYDDGTTRHGWPTITLGFELPFRRSYNWLFEYHALDGLRRSRFLVGLATRGGVR